MKYVYFKTISIHRIVCIVISLSSLLFLLLPYSFADLKWTRSEQETKQLLDKCARVNATICVLYGAGCVFKHQIHKVLHEQMPYNK